MGHVVLSSGDIVLQTGQGAVSIANGFVKDYVFNNLNSSAYKRAFVTSNPPKNEVWCASVWLGDYLQSRGGFGIGWTRPGLSER